jgi:hypothetical protein
MTARRRGAGLNAGSLVKRRDGGFVVAALVAAAIAAPVASATAQRCRGCIAEDTLPRLHVAPAAGVRVGAPQKASFAIGVTVGEDWQSHGVDHSRNAALFLEPGIAAGRASLAYIHHGFGHFGSGYGVAATVLRTWDDPLWTRQNTTYAGGELILWPIVFVGPRIGLFRSVGTPSAGARRWMVALDLGFGV